MKRRGSALQDYRYDPYRAADALRMLPFGEDGSITAEDRLTPETIATLRSWGTQVPAVGRYDSHMGMG